MFDRTIEPDPRPAAPHSRATPPYAGRPSPGIRREQGPRVHLLPRTVRVGRSPMWASTAPSPYRDLAEAHFGGHPYTTRRDVNAWVRDGLVHRVLTAHADKGATRSRS